jgi:3-oxoacyl-[acyl-carrier protein] reductase
MNEYSPPVVLITGAGRGLGRGAALELAKTGFSVAINYQSNQEAAEKTATECRDLARSNGHDKAAFHIFKADISSASDRERLVSEVINTFGTLHSLVNNAGIAPPVRADILDATEEQFLQLMKTNLLGPYFLTQLVARRWMTEEKSCSDTCCHQIIFVTSISAETASTNRGDYCISKAGLAMTVQLWAARLAAHGIGVYEVRPGIMETDMTAGVKETYDTLLSTGLVPQMRWGKPEDLGKAVRALIQGDFSFSTGSVIHTDGGFHISRL